VEITQIQAFVTVAEQGSFSLAAEALHITQPAVSKRISALESSLDKQLFDRLPKKLVLTPAGEALLPRARRVLVEVAHCRSELLSLDGQLSGPLALGTSFHIGQRRLPKLLRHYIDSHPNVRVDLQLTESENALNQVLDHSLELAVITLPSQAPAGIICEHLWTDKLVLCASIDHPLAQLPDVSAAVLCEHLGQVLEINYLETNKGLVEAGLGWTLLPKNMMSDALCELPVEHINLQRELGVVRLAGKSQSSAATAMLELLLQERDQ